MDELTTDMQAKWVIDVIGLLFEQGHIANTTLMNNNYEENIYITFCEMDISGTTHLNCFV